jgi:UDP-glucose 4-epimerase
VRVAVTGGAGFIGSNLCRALAADERIGSVVVLDDLSTGDRRNLDGVEVELVEGSILEQTSLDRAVEGAEAIVHLAARGSVPRSLAEPMAVHAVNTTGTAMVLEAARRHGGAHTIVAGSSSVYGADPTLPKHEGLLPRPVSPYGATKLADEAYALAWAASYDLPVLVFRFFNVFGPFQPAGHAYAAVIPRFVDAALRGEPVTVHGDGRQTRDFTFVDSVTAVIVDALDRRVTHPGPVNLAFGGRISLLELLDELESLLRGPIRREHVDARRADIRHTQADDTLLRSLFPDVPAVPVNRGLARTVEWMRTVGAPDAAAGDDT